MLMRKGGVTRDINADRLHEYTAKGYAPVVTAQAAPAAPKGEKRPEKGKAKE